MKKFIITYAFASLALLLFTVGTHGPAIAIAGDADATATELREIKADFAPVLALKGTPAAGQINAIANLLSKGDGKNMMLSIDLTKKSGEFCMLEPETKGYMVHFAIEPEKTTEDILYFLSAATFGELGMRLDELPIHPSELGQMEPLKWYYYDGKAKEPHHGKALGRPYIVIAIDVK